MPDSRDRRTRHTPVDAAKGAGKILREGERKGVGSFFSGEATQSFV